MMAKDVTFSQPPLKGDTGSLTQVTRNNEQKPQVVGVEDTAVTVAQETNGRKGLH